MVKRTCRISKSSSFFLFGARGTGKTTLLNHTPFLANAYRIDLLLPDEEARYSLNPGLLFEVASPLQEGSWIVVDEVQKLPKLLDVIHKIIEEKRIKFALTGSSARKLKRGGANLLAGRAFVYHLFPLTTRELGTRFNLMEALAWGTLPRLFEFEDESDKSRFLHAYVHTYIKEEIQVEQLVRNLDPFRLFLQTAAQMNGEIINYANIARDTGVNIKSVQNYFQILSDTHVGFFLNPLSQSVRKVQRKNPKFYFFDTGVQRALQGRTKVPLMPGSSEFGNAFETWFINECIREIAYREHDYRLSYLRTKDDVEVDLVIERAGKAEMIIEIKSTDRVDDRHTRSLAHFSNDFPDAGLICVSRDPIARTQGRIKILPWEKGLSAIFAE